MSSVYRKFNVFFIIALMKSQADLNVMRSGSRGNEQAQLDDLQKRVCPMYEEILLAGKAIERFDSRETSCLIATSL